MFDRVACCFSHSRFAWRVVGPRLFSQVDSSKVEVAKTQVRMLKTALQAYRLDVGRYPLDQSGLGISREARVGQILARAIS